MYASLKGAWAGILLCRTMSVVITGIHSYNKRWIVEENDLLTFNNTTQINLVDELSNRTTNSCLANTYSLNFDKELYFYPAWPEKGRIRARWAKKSSSGGVGKELQFFATFPLVPSRVSCASPDWLKGNRHGGPSPIFCSFTLLALGRLLHFPCLAKWNGKHCYADNSTD